jgi:hypothetical protein
MEVSSEVLSNIRPRFPGEAVERPGGAGELMQCTGGRQVVDHFGRGPELAGKAARANGADDGKFSAKVVAVGILCFEDHIRDGDGCG